MIATLILACASAIGQVPAQEARPEIRQPSTSSVTDPPNADLRTQVAKLVRKLDSDRKATRDQAEEDLVKLGPDALEFLPKGDTDTHLSADQTERLIKIRARLEHDRAEQSFTATTVSLHGKMTLAKALAALQSQTGNQVQARQADDAANSEIDAQFDQTPFFTALDSLCDQTKTVVYPYGAPNTLQVRNRLPDELPLKGHSVLSGPLRIEPIRVLASRDLRKAEEASLIAMLEVAWEPRLVPIVVKLLNSTIEATDDRGQTLPVRDPQTVKEAFGRGSASAVVMEVPLCAPATPALKIGHLKGSIRAMFPGQVEAFRFSNLLKKGPQEMRIAAAKVTLEEVRKNGDTWEFAVHVAFDDAGDALDSHRNWILQNPAYLEGADGKPIPYDSLETTERAKNAVGLSYQFALKELPAQGVFVYKTPAMIVTKDFEFVLKDIRLP